MNSIPIDRRGCVPAGAYSLGVVIAILVSTSAHAQHAHGIPTPNVGCPHGYRHLPGHHGHHCQYGSTPLRYQAPTYHDYQPWMHAFETGPPADHGDLATQIKQINAIQKRVEQAVLKIQADQEKLRQQVQAQTSWDTRGAARNLSGPDANVDRRSIEPRELKANPDGLQAGRHPPRLHKIHKDAGELFAQFDDLTKRLHERQHGNAVSARADKSTRPSD